MSWDWCVRHDRRPSRCITAFVKREMSSAERRECRPGPILEITGLVVDDDLGIVCEIDYPDGSTRYAAGDA